MNLVDEMNLKMGNAVCYSGFREGQNPDNGNFPSKEEIKEDLLLLEDWDYIRLYDAGINAERVLEVISENDFKHKVMIGTCLAAESSNPDCPWGADYSAEQLEINKIQNHNEMNKIIDLANRYPDVVFAVSIGNEASVEWTDHLVPVASLISYARHLKANVKQPVTFNENYVPWQNEIKDLVNEVDFISIHTYPVWEYKTIDEALDFTIENYNSVKGLYPEKSVIITEAGWATNTNGKGIPNGNANEEFQSLYYERLMKWTNDNKILCFFFEAFDEVWKGSDDPLEPEKHWGLYTIDRKKKLVIRD